MNRIRAYQILKISENASETEIRDAYRRLLSENNPEDNPEGFMQLRQAYDTAMQYLYEAEEEEDDFEDEEPIARKTLKQPVKTLKTVNSAKPKTTANFTSAKTASANTKVSPIRTRKSANDMAVCVVKPRNMEDAREITETLLANCTVVLNMEGLDLDLAQRIIDFTSGSCYAINGNLQKISNYIFIITPSSVDVSGDFQDLLNGAFDIPSMNFNY